MLTTAASQMTVLQAGRITVTILTVRMNSGMSHVSHVIIDYDLSIMTLTVRIDYDYDSDVRIRS